MKPLVRVVGLAVAVAVFGCGPVPDSTPVKSQHVSAASGATIEVSAADNPTLAGTKLEIPAGALASDTTITVALAATSLVASEDSAGPVTVWGPNGLKFSTPVRMTV